jgi:hypothetical protein
MIEIINSHIYIYIYIILNPNLRKVARFLFYGSFGAITLDVELMLNENLGGILGGTQC